MTKEYKISIEKDENDMFVWEVIWLPACYTQAKTVPELLDRLMEVAEWSLEIVKDLNKKENFFGKKFNFSLKVDYAKA